MCTIRMYKDARSVDVKHAHTQMRIFIFIYTAYIYISYIYIYMYIYIYTYIQFIYSSILMDSLWLRLPSPRQVSEWEWNNNRS